MSKEYEARGLTEVCVDNEQVAALHTENNRERTLNISRQQDIDMLREQYAKSEEIRHHQEAEILEEKEKIRAMQADFQQQINSKEMNHQQHHREKESSYQQEMREKETTHQ